MQGLMVLICGGVLSLVLLAMLYGEKLSLVGLFDGRWLTPIAQLFGNAWSEILLGFDRSVTFLVAHFSWVMAAVSGTVGLSLIAFVMFSGMADDAAAVNRDSATPLFAGGVLDRIPEVQAVVPQPIMLVSHYDVGRPSPVLQAYGGGYGLFEPALPQHANPSVRVTRNDLLDHWPLDAPLTQIDRPELSLELRRLASESPVTDSAEETYAVSRVIEDRPFPHVVDAALRRLKSDDWSRSLTTADWRGRPLTIGDALPESTNFEVVELERGLRIIPGDSVSENDLRIEKLAPRESGGNQLTIEIHLLNQSPTAISGLLVREYLPVGVSVLKTVPDATWQNGVLTWLVNDLRPFEELSIQFTVLVEQQSRFRGPVTFGSQTEVSAVTAVQSRTIVSEPVNYRPRGPVSIPEFEPLPERVIDPVRLPPRTEPQAVLVMTMREPDVRPEEDEWTEYVFEIKNTGDAPAENVVLNLELDSGLRHYKLAEDALDRRLECKVRQVLPDETRTVILRTLPTRRGLYFCTAELTLNGSQVDLQPFDIMARAKLEADPESTPEPAPALIPQPALEPFN